VTSSFVHFDRRLVEQLGAISQTFERKVDVLAEAIARIDFRQAA
jgi:hypothetical protein